METIQVDEGVYPVSGFYLEVNRQGHLQLSLETNVRIKGKVRVIKTKTFLNINSRDFEVTSGGINTDNE